MRAGRAASLLVALAVVVSLAVVTSGASTPAVGASAATGHSRVTTITLQAAHAYRPSAPAGATDDYHCTLVDPHVATNSMIVSSQFLPESPEVHHAILFLVPPDLASVARAADHVGEGWTCFGESALPGTSLAQISNTPWLSAWAPGRKLDVLPAGTGVSLPAGSLVVMQIHYNMLVGHAPVRSKLLLNTVPDDGTLQRLQLDLLPAPPDLPCPAGVSGPLCDRAASLADTGRRFGEGAVGFVNVIESVCGRDPANPPGGVTTSCTWPLKPGRVVRLTAHMHLLGTGMKLVLDPGTPRAQTLLDVTNYDFHNQRSYNLATPVTVSRGDRLQVTCTYDPTIRQKLPSLRTLPPRYVTWGDGSSDEMCLALVQSLPT